MKYSVLGFNQAKAVEMGLKITDLMLLQYIMNACGSVGMKHKLDEDNNPYVWIQHSKLLEDLPILDISEGTLRNKILALKDSGFIASITVNDEHTRGSRTYYGITTKTMSLLYDISDTENTTTSLQNDMVTRPRHFKMTPDNILTNNNILDNSNTNVLLRNSRNHHNTEQSSVESKAYNADDNVIVRKPRKKNLYDKCYDYIIQYTNNAELQNKLEEYLKLRLEIARNDSKPFYYNMWTSLVNRLDSLSDSIDKSIKIVEQSIQCGWKSFYELKDFSNNHGNRNAGMQEQMPDAKAFSNRAEKEEYESKLVEDAIKHGRRAYY